MYRLLFLSCLLLLTKYSFSQGISYNKGGTKVKDYFLEIPYQDISGKLIIKVQLNHVDYNFLFDTGAPTCLSTKVRDAINADKQAEGRVNDVNGNQASQPTVVIKDIALGNLHFYDTPAIVGVPEFFQCWNVDGILGSNLLRNSIVQINSNKKTIIITDQAEKLQLDIKSSANLSLDTVQSYPVFNAKLADNSTLPISFDTGDSGLLSLSDQSMQQLKKSNVFESITKGYGANQVGFFGLEKYNQKFLLKFPEINIGGIQLKNVMTVTDKGSGARMGSKLLAYGIVTIDFVNRNFYLQSDNKKIDVAEKTWPFQPTFNNNKLVVGLVWSEAGNSVVQGEQIVDVDGTSYADVDLCHLLNNKPILEGKEQATITLRSEKGELRKIKVEKNIFK